MAEVAKDESKLLDASTLLKGVGAVISVIQSIQDAKETAEYRNKVVKSLQHIEAELVGIHKELKKVLSELKTIEKAIEYADLTDALRNIQSWGEQVAALDPDDEKGCVNLANDMWAGKGKLNLSDSMDVIHNNMIGDNPNKINLIDRLDLAGTLALRARLSQGVNLLAFSTTFTDKYDFVFGKILWQWSNKFKTQTALIMAETSKYEIVRAEGWIGSELYVTDTIVLIKNLQDNLNDVGLYIDIKGTPTLVHTGTLTMGEKLGFQLNEIKEPPCQKLSLLNADQQKKIPKDKPASKEKSDVTLFVDLETGEHTLEETSALAKNFMKGAQERDSRWLRVFLDHGPYGDNPSAFLNAVTLQSAFRTDPNTTFLSAAGGQQNITRAEKYFVGSIIAGTSIDGPMLVHSAKDKSVKIIEQEDIGINVDISNVLWEVSWAGGKDHITIKSFMNDQHQPSSVVLEINATGTWAIASGEKNIPLQIAVANGTPGPMDNPLKMPVSAATLSMGKNKAATPIIFYAL